MKGVQCYELFGGIALKNHAFFIFSQRPLICSVLIFKGVLDLEFDLLFLFDFLLWIMYFSFILQ